MEKDTLSTAVSEPVILRNGSQPSIKGPDAWFTGTVRIDPLFPAHTPARASSAYVTFEPGARTAWHTHPLGQALIITAGVGRVQVQKIDFNNMLLGIHLIQVIHHSNDSFGTFYLKASYLLLVSYC